MPRGVGLVGLVALLVVLAGCTGGGIPGGPSAGSSGGDGAGGDGGDGADGRDDSVVTWERFNFESGEYYRFEVAHADEDPDYLTWEVLSTDGDEVTAEVTFESGGESVSETVTGQNATVITQMQNTTAMLYLANGPFNAMTNYFASRDLTPGNSWKLAGSEQSGYLTAAVEGTTSYAGKECYVATVRSPDNEDGSDSQSNWDFCIAPDVGLALHTSYGDSETGEPVLAMTLVEYRAGGD